MLLFSSEKGISKAQVFPGLMAICPISHVSAPLEFSSPVSLKAFTDLLLAWKAQATFELPKILL